MDNDILHPAPPPFAPPRPCGYEDVVTLSPLVRRLTAKNPSPFTATGTGTYIVGRGTVAVIDPGPDDPEHINAIGCALLGELVSHIVVTHTHRDHSPGSRPLKALTGAPIVGCAPLSFPDEGPKVEESFDADYLPDRVMGDGETVAGPGWTLAALATPGHTSNHLCYSVVESGALFTGDHVMGWSTSIVAPPDGSMIDYMASLDRLALRDEQLYFSGHGPEIPDAVRFVKFLIRHRKAREASILHRLAKGEADIPTIVRASYIGIDPRLMGAAGYSVLAHLEDLVARDVVATDGDPTIEGTYRLVAPLA